MKLASLAILASSDLLAMENIRGCVFLRGKLFRHPGAQYSMLSNTSITLSDLAQSNSLDALSGEKSECVSMFIGDDGNADL